MIDKGGNEKSSEKNFEIGKDENGMQDKSVKKVPEKLTKIGKI